MELITADEIADRLKLSKRQVAERICYEPDFPAAYRFGRKLRRWNRDEVEAWIRSRCQSKRDAMSDADSR